MNARKATRRPKAPKPNPAADAIAIFQRNAAAILEARGIDGQQRADLEMLAGLRPASKRETAEAKRRLERLRSERAQAALQ